MKIKDYLKTNCLTIKLFAKQVGVSTSTIEKYVYRDRTPSLVVAHKIVVRTNGVISYTDLIPTQHKIKSNEKAKAAWNKL